MVYVCVFVCDKGTCWWWRRNATCSRARWESIHCVWSLCLQYECDTICVLLMLLQCAIPYSRGQGMSQSAGLMSCSSMGWERAERVNDDQRDVWPFALGVAFDWMVAHRFERNLKENGRERQRGRRGRGWKEERERPDENNWKIALHFSSSFYLLWQTSPAAVANIGNAIAWEERWAHRSRVQKQKIEHGIGSASVLFLAHGCFRRGVDDMCSAPHRSRTLNDLLPVCVSLCVLTVWFCWGLCRACHYKMLNACTYSIINIYTVWCRAGECQYAPGLNKFVSFRFRGATVFGKEDLVQWQACGGERVSHDLCQVLRALRMMECDYYLCHADAKRQINQIGLLY